MWAWVRKTGGFWLGREENEEGGRWNGVNPVVGENGRCHIGVSFVSS